MLTRTILMNKMFNKNMTLKQVEDEAKSLGLEIRDYVPRFSDEELDQYYNAVLNDGYWQNFCRQIHIPGDKEGKMMAHCLHYLKTRVIVGLLNLISII